MTYQKTRDEVTLVIAEVMETRLADVPDDTLDDTAYAVRDAVVAWLENHDRDVAERAWDAGAEEQYYMSEKVFFSRLNPYRKETT